MLIKVVLCLFVGQLTLIEASVLEDLRGCFTVPQVCPNKNITFWLYTRKTQNSPHQLDILKPDSIKNAPFVPNALFKILIHGYTGWKDYSPNTEIRPALFEYGEYNVISVDYGPIVKEPCYLNARQNIYVASNCTAQLIDYLVANASIALADFHVIGFSLGAHVTGLLFEFLKSGKLDRITGLDPAMPLFWGTDDHTKLDRGDAKYVDIIHTNALTKGKFLTCGHVDFYCNKGRSQPGCDDPGVENESSCNHARAPAYYAESINSKIGFWGVSCPKLKSGNCSTQIMGFHVPITTRGIYFLNTNSAPPFAQGKGNVTGFNN